MDTRAYLALNLGGTPSQETGTIPPSCILLDNRLYIVPAGTSAEMTRNDWNIPHIPRPRIIVPSLICQNSAFFRENIYTFNYFEMQAKTDEF